MVSIVAGTYKPMARIWPKSSSRENGGRLACSIMIHRSAYLNRSASFMKYMEDDELEADAVLEAMWQESDDDSAP